MGKNYALEWYKYGLEKKDDSIIKFMMHWIAFNWLYSEYRHFETSEKNAIREFCREHYNELAEFDAFSTDAIKVFLEEPVHDVMSASTRISGINQYRSLKEDDGLTRLTSLFLTIYQVRCNLFHGSKSLHIERDVELVRSSAVILEGYLKSVLGAYT